MRYQNKETKQVIYYDGKTTADAWYSAGYSVSLLLGVSKKTGRKVYKREKFDTASEAKQHIADFLNCKVEELNNFKI